MNAALTTNNTSMQIPPPRKYGRFRRVIRGNMLCAASPKSLVKYSNMASQKKKILNNLKVTSTAEKNYDWLNVIKLFQKKSPDTLRVK